jgi:Predicted epimerase, PhzC/PhzF homolog
VDLCGHATLATAFVLHHHENYPHKNIPFHSPRSGELPVSIRGDQFELNFPADNYAAINLTDELLSLTDKKPIAAFKGKTDYMLVFEQEADIKTIQPNLP